MTGQGPFLETTTQMPPMRTPMPMPRPDSIPLLPPIFGGGRMPPPPPLMQQPRAQAGGISDLLAALQGGGNSPLYDQIAPPQAEAGPSPYADFQYLLDTPASERGYGFVPPPVDEAYGVDLGPIDPSDIDTRTPEELNEPMDVFDEPIINSAPRPEIMPDIRFPPEVTAPEPIINSAPRPEIMPDIRFPTEFTAPETIVPDPVMEDVTADPAGTRISLPGGGSFLLTPDMQARIDEMQAKVAANQAAPAANPAMTMSPEELAALRERLGNMNFGGFGGNFNIPTQAVAPEAAPATTPESLMAQMPNNSFMGGAFDREALMARIKAMQAQNAVNPVKMDGPRTISGGGSTVKTGAPRPMMMGRNPMFRGGR